MDSSISGAIVSVWRPVVRFDGSRAKVDQATGELVPSVCEVIGLWSLDDALAGLLAEAEDQADHG